MKLGWLCVAAAIVAMPGLPAPAAASTLAYSAQGSTNLREGPGTGYRVIQRVNGGTPIYVDGCLADWSWCQVSARADGWMSASRIWFYYGGRLVHLPEYRAYSGVPIVAFGFGVYRRPPAPEGNYLGHPGGGGPGPNTLPPP